jgi:hypothetical protein
LLISSRPPARRCRCSTHRPASLYQATKGILRKVNKLPLTALRLAASRKESTVGESILLDATTEAPL